MSYLRHSHDDLVEHWGRDGRGAEVTVVPSRYDDGRKPSFFGRYVQMTTLADSLEAILVPGHVVTATDADNALRLKRMILEQHLDYEGKL